MTIFDEHRNLALGTVSAGSTIIDSATGDTIVAASDAEAAEFPAVPFFATVWRDQMPMLPAVEIVRATAFDGVRTFTVLRAQQGTSAQLFVSQGWKFANTITVADVVAIEDAVSGAEAGLAAETAARIAGDAATLAATEAYADGKVATEAGVRAAGDAATLASAETYSDGEVAAEAATRGSADSTLQTHIDAEASARAAGDASTLSSAGTYTDAQVAAEAALRASGDSTTLAAAEAYTDGKVVAGVRYRGAINASTNPNLPAANLGDLYAISVPGTVSGIAVEAGDMALCKVDATPANTPANWDVVQTNINGAVTGPASATDQHFAQFNGTSGKVIEDTGLVLDTDGTLAANSDLHVSTQKAVKTYVDAHSGSQPAFEHASGIGQWLLSIVDQGNADATIAVASDSTGLDATGDGTNGWVHRLAAYLNATYPAYTVNYYLWDSVGLAWPGTPTATYAGSGAQKIDIWNLSKGGAKENYGIGFAESQLAVKQPHLLFLAYGENDDTLYDRFRNRMLSLVETVLWKSPKTEVVLVAQPPQMSPATGTGQQELRLLELDKLSRTKGIPLINVLRAFQETGNVSGYLAADGIHPNDAGKTLWLNTVTARMVLNKREGPRSSRPSGLTVVGNQQILDGEFATWPPDSGGWSLNNVTATKDTGVFETPYTYSAKLAVTASTTFGAYISQALPSSCIGKWVTLAVRLYVPSGQTDDTTLGRVGITSTNIDANHGITDGSGQRDAWYWEIVTVYIDPTDTSPIVKINVDTKGGNATHVGDYIRVQRVYAVVGDEPRIALPAGATGATGPSGPAGPAGPEGTAIRSVLATTIDRRLCANITSIVVNQQLFLVGVYLPSGVTVSSISFMSGTTALAGGNHQWFGLFDDDLGSSSGTARARLALSGDDTSTAWGANTLKTLNMASPYVTTRSGFFYIGILVDAGTVPSVFGYNPAANKALSALGPAAQGLADSAITALPNPAAAPVGLSTSSFPYAHAS